MKYTLILTLCIIGVSLCEWDFHMDKIKEMNKNIKNLNRRLETMTKQTTSRRRLACTDILEHMSVVANQRLESGKLNESPKIRKLFLKKIYKSAKNSLNKGLKNVKKAVLKVAKKAKKGAAHVKINLKKAGANLKKNAKAVHSKITKGLKKVADKVKKGVTKAKLHITGTNHLSNKIKALHKKLNMVGKNLKNKVKKGVKSTKLNIKSGSKYLSNKTKALHKKLNSVFNNIKNKVKNGAAKVKKNILGGGDKKKPTLNLKKNIMKAPFGDYYKRNTLRETTLSKLNVKRNNAVQAGNKVDVDVLKINKNAAAYRVRLNAASEISIKSHQQGLKASAKWDAFSAAVTPKKVNLKGKGKGKKVLKIQKKKNFGGALKKLKGLFKNRRLMKMKALKNPRAGFNEMKPVNVMNAGLKKDRKELSTHTETIRSTHDDAKVNNKNTLVLLKDENVTKLTIKAAQKVVEGEQVKTALTRSDKAYNFPALPKSIKVNENTPKKPKVKPVKPLIKRKVDIKPKKPVLKPKVIIRPKISTKPKKAVVKPKKPVLKPKVIIRPKIPTLKR